MASVDAEVGKAKVALAVEMAAGEVVGRVWTEVVAEVKTEEK